MIPGREGLIIAGGYTMNDRSAAKPRVRIDNIVGLRAKPDFDPENDPATGRTGEVARDAELRGKNVTYEGVIEADSVVDLRSEQSDFGAVLANTGEILWVHKHDPSWTLTVVERHFRGRIITGDPGEDASDASKYRDPRTGGYESPISIVTRLSDPRFYFATETEETSSSITANGDGTANATDPDGGYLTAAARIDVNCDNEGNFKTEAEIYVEGPVTNPIITNETTGKFLRFGIEGVNDLILDAGEGITIDTKRRRVTRNSGTNQRDKVDPLSTWWDKATPALQPGVNNIRLRGHELTAGAELTVTFTSADIS